MNKENTKTRRALSDRTERRGLTAQTADEYLRERDLPRLIAVWPGEVADQSRTGTIFLIRKLKNALRSERQRGRAGHWSYDLGRHLGLAKALKMELSAYTGNQEPVLRSVRSCTQSKKLIRPHEGRHTD